MPKASESRFDYVVHFMAPYHDPRREPQIENHLYLVTMTQEQADRATGPELAAHGLSLAIQKCRLK
jgi:hypothetical protein